MQQCSVITIAPSFNSYTAVRFAETASKVCEEFSHEREELGLEVSVTANNITEELPPKQSSNDRPQEQKAEGNSNDDTVEDDFEFAFVSKDPDGIPISADELFSNGQIRPIFPLFNRDLLFAGGHDEDSKRTDALSLRLPLGKHLIKERDPASTSSSEGDELEAVPAGSYCVWKPKPVEELPETCKKSNSTGYSKRWRFRDLLHRSNSDGKDTFVFLTPSTTCSKTKKTDEKVEKVDKAEVSKEMRNSGEAKIAGKVKTKGVTGEAGTSAHEIHYVRNRALKEGERRRSFLPYRQELVGVFANVNGTSKSLHPF